MKLSDSTTRKFVEEYPGNGRQVLTDTGYKPIRYVRKTIPYEVYVITTVNGFTLECADTHIIIDENYHEVFAKDSLNAKVLTSSGPSEIIKVEKTDRVESMYDLEVDSDTHLYYSSGILSHNSVVAGIYLLWESIFRRDILIGIAANKNSSAKEVLNKIKKIFLELPIWLMPGVSAFNKTFVDLENGVKILTDSTNGDSFRGYTVNVLYIDEVSWIKASQWADFEDAVFPAQGALAWKKTILTSTMKGLNHWYHIVQKARRGEEYFYHYAGWQDVPRYDKNGDLIEPEVFRDQIINKYDLLYWNQNYLNEAIGSSHTLLSPDTLKTLESVTPETIIPPGLNVYSKPQKGHQYIFAVDPSKDGIDAFSIQVVDITNFNFKQAASAKLQIDYLLMPEFIDEWARWYNNAFLIIENNEGAGQSIADQMYQTYEYENLYFDKSNETNKRKKYPGFRTTSKSRKLILNTLKTFIENDNLDIVDSDTIKEFFTFVLDKGKYQADEGTHDDMIMALALVFAPFCNTKNFEDMKVISRLLFGEHHDSEEVDISDIIVIGDFDDATDVNEQYQRSSEFNSYEGFI